MARVNAQQWLDKWGRRLNAAGPDITAGINRVNVAPGQQAAAAQALALQKLTEAFTSGVWANQVSKVTLQEWKDAITSKGLPRIAQGVNQAQKTAAPDITALLAAVDQAAAAANAMPKGDIEQSIARAAEFMRNMARLAPKRQK